MTFWERLLSWLRPGSIRPSSPSVVQIEEIVYSPGDEVLFVPESARGDLEHRDVRRGVVFGRRLEDQSCVVCRFEEEKGEFLVDVGHLIVLES